MDRGVDAALAKVASGVVGPMLVGYALWVAAQARRRGIKRLYYAARDGQVMYKVAQHVMARVAPDIEVRYLYGSRQAWVASASAFSDDVLKRWLVVPRDSTARTTLRRVGLDVERLHQETRLPFLRGDRADSVLSHEDHRELGERLFAEPVLSWVKAAAAETAAGTIAYLRQEGLFDGTPSALVDSGWGGMTAHALDVLLKQEGGSAVSHFFVGRTNPPDPNLPPLEGAVPPLVVRPVRATPLDGRVCRPRLSWWRCCVPGRRDAPSATGRSTMAGVPSSPLRRTIRHWRGVWSRCTSC